MRRADFPSDAAYYRAHRAVFLFALERGITPRDAEIELKQMAAQACRDRLAAKMNAPLRPGMADFRAGHDPEERPEPYWQRD